ncbi:MAG TPA: 3-oxoacyl-[acyl-carrier-protein] reductase [Verrucomicrobiae bacterium]|nr:3-oxoacyl-[acyl-carrier-protein] reductase [Verrucomicrobiae bacterium]
MQKLLEDKVAVVTGAGRGIGESIARRLAGEGAAIAVCDVMLENAQQVASDLAKGGTKANAYAVNVTDSKQVKEVCDKIVADFSRVDILVNNAGITRDGLLLRMSDEDWDAVLGVNLKGAFLFTRAIGRTMLQQRSGVIVNIASIVGVMGNAGQANYSASKAGLIGFTKTVAKELASRGIRANAVAPGFIQTPMTDKLSPEARKAQTDFIALKRLGLPQDVANVVLFLASDLSSYVTGQVISVDGGLAM